jgi:hypothetical protein
MPNADISRYLNQPRKHYTGARFQQGRPFVDSDFNDGAEASSHDFRETLLDVIGAAGAADDGFMPVLKIGDVIDAKLVRFGVFTQAFVLDYALKAGSMYAGGELWVQNESEPIVFQREFLQMGAATAPRAAVGEQRQLSYLRGWEQPVTAVEDGELLEPSLAGADGAARVRRVRRIETRNVQATDCAAAFAEVLEDLGNGDTATYDQASCELRSNARLRMTFKGSPEGECGPCSPSLEGRYLGGEGNAIRIMLAAPDRYVWACDNAAPVYRVRLVLDGGGGTRVEMITPPKDSYHYPKQHTIVEFLPWEALLDNGRPQGGKDGKISGETVVNEKIAARVGFFGEADGPYDPANRTFHVRLASGSAIELGIGKGKTESKAESQAVTNLKSGTGPSQDGFALRWDEQHPFSGQLNAGSGSSAEGFVAFVYMRLWHLNQSGATLTIPTSSTAPLGQTGLVPVFTGRGRAGDFWTITVRPEAPDEILPREIMLEGGSPPHGPREVVTQISLVTWRSFTGISHEVIAIDDCRPTLPFLTERGCCTYDVGPGGDFETIQAAVNELPPTGGRLCVRPGVYQEEIRIQGKSNVIIAGCGEETRIESPEETQNEALVDIVLGDDGTRVTLSGLTIDARAQLGLRITGGSRVQIERLNIRTIADERGPESPIRALGCRDLRITGCRVEMGGEFSDHAAIYVDAPDGALIEGNTVDTLADQDDGFSHAWGGIQVAGGSSNVEIRDNVIRGGRGHGITLGSVLFGALDGSRRELEGAGRGQSIPDPPFAVTGIITPVAEGDNVFFPEPRPAIDALVISDNQIERVGGSGISSVVLQVDHDPRATGPPLCFRRTTFELTNSSIEDNRIRGNARQRAENPGNAAAFGGIVLSDARRVTIRGNLVEENGAGTLAPICGICVARGDHVSVISNRIRGNGAVPPGGLANPPMVPLPGDGNFGPRFQGGIVIAAPNIRGGNNIEGENSPRNIHIRRNVVDQPDATAALVISRGTCRITGNHFHSHALEQRLFGPTVLVFSTGRPWEGVDLPVGEPNPDRWVQPDGSFEFLNGRAQELPEGDGGAVCFNGNQVTTNGVSNPPTGGFGAWLFSSDSVLAVGNQFAARSPETSDLPHLMVIGATTDASVNRVAEGVNATTTSLAALGAMMTACAGNHLTHCPVVFGCRNHNNPDYFVEEDNLVWLRLPGGECTPAREVLVALQNFCGLFLGRTPGLTNNLSVAVRRGGQL